MTKQKVHVIIDSNEVAQNPEIVGKVYEHEEVESYEEKDLPAADLEIEGIGFERKTPSDYIGSLKKGRLTEQTHKLGQRYEHAYVLYEGDLVQSEQPFKSGMEATSIRGSMASLTAREESGVRAVIPVSNMDLLIDMAIRIARKHIEESDQEYIPKPATAPDEPTAKMMYACIDGVGPSMAQTLYEEYPTITEFIERADYEALQDLDGIGENRAIQIIEAFV